MVLNNACIIGAGSSGIAACKVFQEYDILFDCYEKGSEIGGNWRYNNDNGVSSAYRSLHINTSRDVMAYSDYPMPKDYPHFPHHSQIIKYFEDYADHFGFRDKITFNTTVEEVRKNEDGTYTVLTSRGEEKQYKSVVVANGHHWSPRYPEPAFEGSFEGETLHSHYYKTPDILANKNVLVVGFGNSAVDIACEAARLHTGNVFLSTRSGAYVVPNYFLGMPFDQLANPQISQLPLAIQRQILSTALWIARGKQESYGIPKPKRRILSEHPTLSQEFLSIAGKGLVKLKPNIKSLAGNRVLFEDESNEAIDIIIYATGYKVSFPFFKPNFIDVEEDNDIQLYKRVVHPKHNNLYFVGLIQPLGAIMPLAEVQSIYIAKLLTGEVALPSQSFMELDIQKEKEKVEKRYKGSPRHTLQVDFYPYKRLLEKEMKQMRTEVAIA